MANKKKGELRYKRDKVEAIADEMKAWMLENEDQWMIKEFAVMKQIPYRYFTDVFPTVTNYYKEIFEFCLDLQEVRYWKKVVGVEGAIPQTFGIFGAKNLLGYRDKQDLPTKKSNNAPESKSIKERLDKAKDKYFPKVE